MTPPRVNAYAERFLGTLRRECHDHLLIYGRRHLRSVVADYQRHHNGHRRTQIVGFGPPLHKPGPVVDMNARIQDFGTHRIEHWITHRENAVKRSISTTGTPLNELARDIGAMLLSKGVAWLYRS
jgi:hypothetical protein